MKPKIKKSGKKWLVYGWDTRYFQICNSWEEALTFALNLTHIQKKKEKSVWV